MPTITLGISSILRFVYPVPTLLFGILFIAVIVATALRARNKRLYARRPSFTNLAGNEKFTPPLKDGRRGSVYDECPNTTRTDAEIKAFGRFPDYAALTEVPLPSAYKEFDISKALPRPYRPFRWAYHQTMCKFLWHIMRFAHVH